MGCYNTGCGSYQKWFIGNDIRSLLLADEDIYQQVGEHIYPLVAPENTKGDFIVYMREKYSKTATKMGVYEDDCELAIVGISDNYDSAVSLASKIDNALTGRHTINSGATTITINLSNSTETFDDNKYIETMVFNIK